MCFLFGSIQFYVTVLFLSEFSSIYEVSQGHINHEASAPGSGSNISLGTLLCRLHKSPPAEPLCSYNHQSLSLVTRYKRLKQSVF